MVMRVDFNFDATEDEGYDLNDMASTRTLFMIRKRRKIFSEARLHADVFHYILGKALKYPSLTRLPRLGDMI